MANPSPYSILAIHHLTSSYEGAGQYYGRGGTEIAKWSVAGRASFEWGGEDANGQNILAEKRPNWAHGPIHDMLVQLGNQLVIKGHDHFHARQALDGMIYLTLAKPDDTGEQSGDLWGWRWYCFYPLAETTFQPNSGFLAVDAQPDAANFSYIQTYPVSGIGTVLDSFTLLPGAGTTSVGGTAAPALHTWIREVAPNPSRDGSRIDFELGQAGSVRLAVYDASGRLVRDLLHENLAVGAHIAAWDGCDAWDGVAAGVHREARDAAPRRLGEDDRPALRSAAGHPHDRAAVLPLSALSRHARTDEPARRSCRSRRLSSIRFDLSPKSIVDLDFVRDLSVRDGEVRLSLELPSPEHPSGGALCDSIRERLAALPGVKKTEIHVAWRVRDGESKKPPIPGVKQVVAVASGKGGVGKSTVASNLAAALSRLGAQTGLLDLDIYGPSVPVVMGESKAPMTDGQRLLPSEAHGLRFLSMGQLAPKDQPVLWRGPMLHKMVTQLAAADWGGLDYLVLDLPPGTGDVQLTLTQTLPVTGAIVVTTPQEIALIDARKGLTMFRDAHIPILGIVENMAWYDCRKCGKRHAIFGAEGGKRLAEAEKVALLAQLPLDPAVMAAADAGRPIALGDSPPAALIASSRSTSRPLAGLRLARNPPAFSPEEPAMPSSAPGLANVRDIVAVHSAKGGGEGPHRRGLAVAFARMGMKVRASGRHVAPPSRTCWAPARLTVRDDNALVPVDVRACATSPSRTSRRGSRSSGAADVSQASRSFCRPWTGETSTSSWSTCRRARATRCSVWARPFRFRWSP